MEKTNKEIMVEFTKDYVKKSAKTFLVYGSILAGILLISSTLPKPKIKE